MRTTTQRSVRGKHRNIISSQTAKGRIALVAVATGVVSTAGVTGAAAASLQAPADDSAVDIELAANTGDISSSAPQILAIAEFKPDLNIDNQLAKAVQYSAEKAQEDLAARAPAIAEELSGIISTVMGANGAYNVAKPAEGTLTSGYGMRWGTLHAGIDIANSINTPILAVMDGVVIDSGPASGYGQWIRIQHDDGSMSVYGHMETLNVNVGDVVTAGQNIAGMGNRGFSTGSHLHFEIHPTGSGAVDPVPWLAEHGILV
ncbi:M23 family metallopeptidase [Corynebacterium alimapuense]|uniref:Endopeptidase n=1 Tax=Corynebacterium alimapuense TaxID=1576874 RepID=A0A3M8K822_9CORY|nr:M23 family metallopeptidase [Corynebacterium alimapuense]RNE48618.1 endopeptidase [Corynebacterium alimapuense]